MVETEVETEIETGDEGERMIGDVSELVVVAVVARNYCD